MRKFAFVLKVHTIALKLHDNNFEVTTYGKMCAPYYAYCYYHYYR